MRVAVRKSALGWNERIAARLRRRFRRNRVTVVNVMSSPGSGKTSLLEHTARRLGSEVRLAAIEGDMQTDRDARRLRAVGLETALINTGRGCHLDAQMIENALGELRLADIELLLVENVGNLVCPAAFDLGETASVAVFSTTEGHDKPAKYPEMFRRVDLVVLNKTDLAEAADFDSAAFAADVRSVNGQLPILPLSCKTGEGLDAWLDWLRGLLRASRRAPRRKAAPQPRS
jgi:hydrogenase nickel incorporation protein HypB